MKTFLNFGICVATVALGLALRAEGQPNARANLAAAPNPIAPVCVVPLSAIRVKDGDTIEANIDFPLKLSLRDESIRMDSYDAWETSKRRRSVKVTDEEIQKGLVAKQALVDWLRTGKPYLRPQQKRDVYGRVLGTLYIEKQGVLYEAARFMTKNGHARK